MSSFIRKVVLLQGAIASPRILFPQSGRGFSTVSESVKKVKIPNFEIKSASDIQFPKPPMVFPFKIEDIAGKDFIKLKRNFAGEKMVVVVTEPIFNRDKESDETYTYINLIVNLSKANETRVLVMDFTADSDSIETEFIMFEHPDKGIRSESVTFGQKALWREFIRVRGIKDSIGQFLMEYMLKRKERDYLLFLEKLRKFIE